MNNITSRLIEDVVSSFMSLPGVGRKTALRFALHLLRQQETVSEKFGESIIKMRKEIVYCKECNNISDGELCIVCSNPNRKKNIICIVEDIRDIIAIENTQQFNGVYHVLGGIISPMDGIGPSDLNITSLIQKIASGSVSEVVFALKTSIEGDTTSFYIYKKIKEFNIPVSMIARGISFGDDLEYTDEITLGRSIINRTPYQGVTI